MTEKRMNQLLNARRQLKDTSPLIHCITNPISINDCANAVLAVGARPIMAEHPGESAEITASASALAVNLGNITDARMESMLLSGHKARALSLPRIIDVVGVSCSKLRLEYAKRWIAECAPSIIKGNLAEIRMLCGENILSSGIDASDQDQLSQNNLLVRIASAKQLAKKTGSVILASGKTDLITDGKEVFLVDNGCSKMARLTGTGCMLNVLTGAFLSVLPPLSAALFTAAFLGICGEEADTETGMGSFHVRLMDQLDVISDETLQRRAKIIEYSKEECL
ncbi:hydroxyethylthiazole kinase [Hominifimenecus sp. rT4P-3]|uniref:hydroxyethylthiazole kinase n=1 Tax=Hominifimenecus sp. rT4P-3 TaxID=3242979 RepID=UPI003DA3C520